MAKKALVVVPKDDLERRALTAKLEGERPYTKEQYINEVRFYLGDAAASIIEAGKRLLVIKEREGYGNFRAIVEEEIGIPKTTAYRLINAALKSGKFPQIELSQFGTSNVYTLLEAPEEDLKELEEKGVMAGKSVDELSALSVKDMRGLIKELKTGVSNIVGKEVGKVTAENKLLRQELDEFRKIIPAGKRDVSKGEKQLMYAQAKYEEFESALSALSFGKMEIDDIKIGAKIEGLLKTVHARICHMAEKWEDHKKGIIK